MGGVERGTEGPERERENVRQRDPRSSRKGHGGGRAGLTGQPPAEALLRPQADRTGVRHRLASAELHGTELQDKVHDSRGRSPPYQLDSRGRLVLAEAQVGDEQDYVCLVRAGAAGTAEATARLNVFGECLGPPPLAALGRGRPVRTPGRGSSHNISPVAKPEATEVSPNRGTLSVMEDFAQEVPRATP